MNEIPDDLLLSFFRESRQSLLELDCQSALPMTADTTFTTAECRNCVLDKQRSVLNVTLSRHNQSADTGIPIRADQVQERLRTISKQTNLSEELASAVKNHDQAARQCLCKLVLYSEVHRPPQVKVELQSDGKLGRSKLLEYLGLCQTAMQLEMVLTYLEKGGPLFPGLASSESTSIPPKRLEYIQQLLARAVGLDPPFVTFELTRIFVNPATAVHSEFKDDAEIKNLFYQTVAQMQTAVENASLKNLSDQDEGGVTRVVSVQYSEVAVGGDDAAETLTMAPKVQTITETSTQEEQIRQIRLASQAKALQEKMIHELETMSAPEREATLERAQQVTQQFLEKIMELPPGPERIQYLQSIDPETSRLMTMHKLWMAMQQSQE